MVSRWSYSIALVTIVGSFAMPVKENSSLKDSLQKPVLIQSESNNATLEEKHSSIIGNSEESKKIVPTHNELSSLRQPKRRRLPINEEDLSGLDDSFNMKFIPLSVLGNMLTYKLDTTTSTSSTSSTTTSTTSTTTTTTTPPPLPVRRWATRSWPRATYRPRRPIRPVRPMRPMRKRRRQQRRRTTTTTTTTPAPTPATVLPAVLQAQAWLPNPWESPPWLSGPQDPEYLPSVYRPPPHRLPLHRPMESRPPWWSPAPEDIVYDMYEEEGIPPQPWHRPPHYYPSGPYYYPHRRRNSLTDLRNQRKFKKAVALPDDDYLVLLNGDDDYPLVDLQKLQNLRNPVNCMGC